MDKTTILILEDDHDRIRRFRDVIDKAKPQATVLVWNSAIKMVSELNQYLNEASLISLDHDLYLPEEAGDPGDGLIAAKHIASHDPVCPVIVHTSNVDGGNRMEGALDLGGWLVKRVAPIGSDWIESDWLIVAKELGSI